jgi:hypothetical protein
MNIKWHKLLRAGMMLLAGAVAVYLLMHIQ